MQFDLTCNVMHQRIYQNPQKNSSHRLIILIENKKHFVFDNIHFLTDIVVQHMKTDYLYFNIFGELKNSLEMKE